ncbi:uncharacterized protein EI97DRAFT_394093 [Westerdykella ornata]|uniref:Zn(2)-C6 fungal-type domain-containing protein n=1 Tax=Westerdykella ornata TaxID=318751 RepID=A0A6A6JTE4_WESOR|nr:uncharacterized protein EI97DRAFT_394093 [Westerdykella ornata]KAF2279118.1 hypothetical protein EI97DRAFT_394093 [Westerdykella ornata]
MTRNPVACVACRSAKQRCIHNDGRPPCDRCKATGREQSCEFPPPGTSAIHRKPKRPRVEDSTSGLTPPSNSTHSSHRAETAARSPQSTTALLDGVDPFDLLTDDVINSYLRCAYKWSFHHTPTLLKHIRDRTLEPWMAWAILALAIRFVKDTPSPFKSQTEASNAFAAYARQLLQPEFVTPTVSRVQALLMLTGHDWGAGNGQRAWIYLGIAIRLVQTMDLCQEPKWPVNRPPTREEFIDAEVRRRTAWTCFLMDSLLSGGKGRKRSLAAEDMAIQLPCERDAFIFGTPVITERLDGRLVAPSQYPQPTGALGIIAYSMRVANIWGRVARWACSEVVNSELPWVDTSEFQRLFHDLAEWKKSLPDRLQYDPFTLQSHNAMDQGQAYCYMHSIYFMSYMFLYRAYLPVLGPHTGVDDTPKSFTELKDTWKNWQIMSRRELFRESTTVLEMLDEMRSFGVYFLRGLVPWIGFTIYTAVGVMLYTHHFPSVDDDPKIAEKARDRVIKGCTFLKDMQTQWPMATTWYETIKRMQAYYRSAVGHASPVSSDERQALRRAMIDYGALQPSPVQRPGEFARPSDAYVARPAVIHEQPTAVSSPLLMSPPLSTPQNQSTASANGNSALSPALDIDQTFDLNFDFTNSDMEALMMSAQDFWVSFPGEHLVGLRDGNPCLGAMPDGWRQSDWDISLGAGTDLFWRFWALMDGKRQDFQLGLCTDMRLMWNGHGAVSIIPANHPRPPRPSTSLKPHTPLIGIFSLTVACSSLNNVLRLFSNMGVYYETIPDSLRPWILDQKMLLVATAPLSPSGHINVSPKGGQHFGITSPRQFWFMDLSGSGIETTAHLHEPGNGRICVMFMAFEGPPRILRIWGKGRALEFGTPEFNEFVKKNEVKLLPHSRSIILVDIDQVATSCGYAVPFYDFKGFRTVLDDFFEKKEKAFKAGKESESMDRYWALKSQLSVDGLPGMKRGYEFAQQHNVAPLKKFVGQAAPTAPRRSNAVSPVQLALVALLSFIIGAVLTLTVVPPEFVRRVQYKEVFF